MPREQGQLERPGPQPIAGYLQNSKATLDSIPGGRLHTGDVAIMDDGDWTCLADRLKDRISVPGYKVWPREVLGVLYEHPPVREATVIRQRDRGETLVAFVFLKSGASATAEELIDFTKKRLAAHKYPHAIKVICELPKTQTGKIQRSELRDTFSAIAPARDPKGQP
jgi:long-chain acyl-CoA synthetase